MPTYYYYHVFPFVIAGEARRGKDTWVRIQRNKCGEGDAWKGSGHVSAISCFNYMIHLSLPSLVGLSGFRDGK